MRLLVTFLGALCVCCAYAVEISAASWLPIDGKLHKDKTKYIQKHDDAVRFNGSTEGIAYFSTDAIPVSSGNEVTIKMTFSGKGKAHIGINGYKDLNYTHCDQANSIVSFDLGEEEITRNFRFAMKGDGLAALRPIFILTGGSELLLSKMIVSVRAVDRHPALNPLLPEASFFNGPMSIARWIWSPCDIRFSYNRKTKMQDAFFRQRITVAKTLASAEIMAGFRLPGRVFVNGQEILAMPFEQPQNMLQGKKFIVTEALKQGENLLAVEIVNKTDDKSCGLIYLGTLNYADGTVGYFGSSRSNVKAVKDIPSGEWKALDYDDSNWTDAMEMGDASTGRWIKMGDTIALFTTPEECKNYCDTLEAAKNLSPELEARIASEPEPSADIDWKNGLPMIRINSEKEILPFRRIGLATSAPYDGYDFIAKTKDFGMDLYDLGLSDYYSGKSNYWKSEGVYDFSSIDIQAAKMLSINPNAYFIISFGTQVMRQWCLDHPDEVMGYAMGAIDYDAGPGLELDGRPLRPSPASRLFRQELERIYSALSDYVLSKPWAKRVIGIKHTYGVTSEWEYYGSTKQMPDTGTAMTRAFREFLKEKYGSDEKLQNAWKQADATIENANLPSVEERWGDHQFLRNPAKYRNVLDFYDCMHEEMADLMIFSGKTAKMYFPGRLFGTYYSYQNMPRSPEGAKNMEAKILSSGSVDFFCSPNDYNNETRSGGGTGMTRVRTSIMHRYGKLGILEADVRTYIAENCEEVLRLKNLEETLAVIRRDFCNTIFDRTGLQLHQFGGDGPYRGGPDWYNSPEILEEISKNLEVQREVRNIDGMKWTQDIAVVSSYGEFAHHGYPVQDLLMCDYVVWWQIYGLYCSGYTFDYLDIEDYMRSEHNYKVVVFLAPYSFSEATRDKMNAKLRGTGTTAIWIYAPGLVTENGFSDVAMEQLTGIRLKADFRKLPMEIVLDKDDSVAVRDPWHGNQIVSVSPRVFCDDEEAKTKANYSDGPIAYVEKSVDGFKSVFIGVPVSSPWHWASIFAGCGMRKVAEPKVIVRANSCLLMVHVGKGGSYKINLPWKTDKVIDMFSGKSIKSMDNSLNLVCDEPYTWLLKAE